MVICSVVSEGMENCISRGSWVCKKRYWSPNGGRERYTCNEDRTSQDNGGSRSAKEVGRMGA